MMFGNSSSIIKLMKKNNQNLIEQALTRETPGKVLSLLGAALFSVAFLFSVSASNASFERVEVPLPNPFSGENVMAVIDNAAGAYSKFAQINFIEPLMADYKIYGDNLAYVFKESGLAYMLGVERLAGAEDNNIQAPKAQVAGAYTESKPYKAGSFGINALYSILIE